MEEGAEYFNSLDGTSKAIILAKKGELICKQSTPLWEYSTYLYLGGIFEVKYDLEENYVEEVSKVNSINQLYDIVKDVSINKTIPEGVIIPNNE